jgi:hypothetical protein
MKKLTGAEHPADLEIARLPYVPKEAVHLLY